MSEISCVTSTITTATIELVVGAVLTLRFHLAYDQSWGTALWNGLFHSVSAFNNAGFARYTDNMMSFALDPLVLVPLMIAVTLGGIGFPVTYELRRELFVPDKWSLHTKITLLGYVVLLIIGILAAVAQVQQVAREGQGGALLGGLAGELHRRQVGRVGGAAGRRQHRVEPGIVEDGIEAGQPHLAGALRLGQEHGGVDGQPVGRAAVGAAGSRLAGIVVSTSLTGTEEGTS